MLQRIFVFRVSKGNDSGKPNGKCPLDYTEIKRKIASIPQDEIRQIEDSDEKTNPFISNELYSKNVLRQGWGLDNLNLNQDIKIWIENYMESAYRSWSGYQPYCNCNYNKRIAK